MQEAGGLYLKVKDLARFGQSGAAFAQRRCSPDYPRGEDMDKAMLLSQLALALGFLVFIVRALGERMQELRGGRL
jgi:hypothetical protein